MNTELLKNTLKYCDILEMLGTRQMPITEWREEMAKRQTISERSIWRYQNDISSSQECAICIRDDLIYVDPNKVKQAAGELLHLVGFLNCDELEEKNESLRTKNMDLEKQLEDSTRQKKSAESKIELLEGEKRTLHTTIQNLQTQLVLKNSAEAQTLTKNGVILVNTISVGPAYSEIDKCFLTDPVIDLYRGISSEQTATTIASPFAEIPDDKDNATEPFEEIPKNTGRNFTIDNYRRKSFIQMVTEPFLKRKLRLIEAEKQNPLTNDVSVPGPSASLELHDRYTTSASLSDQLRMRDIQELLDSHVLSNQQKLAAYSFLSKYRGTEIQNLLNIAIEYCLNANAVIEILENSDRYGTYENMKSLLLSLKDPSEFRMKYELAKELIAGRWYIVADYNGKMTKFQLVPISELNELRCSRGLAPSKFTYPEMIPDEMKEKAAASEDVNASVEDRYPVTAEDMEMSPDILTGPDTDYSYGIDVQISDFLSGDES